MDSQNDEKIWLVKAAGVVLGPFSLVELADSLKRKTISITDEARGINTRWRFIREHPLLIPVVREVRQDFSSKKEITAAHSLDARTITSTLSEDTPEPPLEMPIKPPTMPGAVDIQAVERKITSTKSTSQSYGSLSDHQVKERLDRSQFKWKKLTWGVALLCMGSAVFYFYQQEKKAGRSLSDVDNIKLSRQYRNLGQYPKAIMFLKRAEQINPLDINLRLSFSELLLSQKEEWITAKNQLDQLERESLTATQKSQWHNLKGLYELRTGKVDTAIFHFDQSANDLSMKRVAELNLGQALLLSSDFEKAYGVYSQSQLRNEPIATLGRAWAAVELVNNQWMSDSVKDLQKLSQSSLEWRVEALLTLIVLQNQLAEINKNTVSMLLDEAPEISQEFNRNLAVSDDYFNRERFLAKCENFKKPEDPLFKGLLAFCFYYAGQLVQAHQILDAAQRQYGNQADLLGIYSWLLIQEQRFSESRAFASQVNVKGKKIALMSMAQSCLKEKDLACAEKFFAQVISENENYLPAMVGMARTLLEKNHKEGAQSVIRKALKLATNYRPINELSDESNVQ